MKYFIDIFITMILYVSLSLPQLYKITHKLLKISGKVPTILSISVHTLIFLITLIIYYHFTNVTESFQLCDPGYQLKDPLSSYNNPYKSWCEYGDGKGDYEDQDEILVDDMIEILKEPPEKCDEVKDDNEEKYDDRDDRCKLKDE